MIIEIKPAFEHSPEVQALCARYGTQPTHFAGKLLVITASSVKRLDDQYAHLAQACHVSDSDIQLASLKYRPRDAIRLGDDLVIDDRSTLLITGPCSVEDDEQIHRVARYLVGQGIKVLRAGAYKPRTSPYSFQGLGKAGLVLLRQVCDQYGLKLITEARDATHIDDVIAHADIIQIGAKAMYDHGILKACGETRKPVLLKRGFGSTLQEFVQAAEFILSRGNPDVILCERGIRTFEDKTRFTLDLCGVAYLKEYINLPVFLDPSHAMGYAYGVSGLARACVAMGVDGLLIETHPTPTQARSDAAQQLDFAQFSALHESLKPIAASIGRVLL